MRTIKSILTTILMLTFANIYANKDRIEKPKSFKFTFEKNEVINLSFSDPRLGMYCDEIVNKKKKLVEAQLTYETGEIITVKYNGKKWTSITISYKDEDLSVPKKVLKKITEIHFSTLNLDWSSDNEIAFYSSYFFIEFDLGIVKSFNKLPQLNINFEKMKFSNCVIWKPVDEKSIHVAEF